MWLYKKERERGRGRWGGREKENISIAKWTSDIITFYVYLMNRIWWLFAYMDEELEKK